MHPSDTWTTDARVPASTRWIDICSRLSAAWRRILDRSPCGSPELDTQALLVETRVEG